MSLSRRELLGGVAFAFVPSLVDDDLSAKIGKAAIRFSDANGVPGCLVHVLRGGKPLASHVSGFRDIQSPNELKIDDRVAVGSLSKPIAGYVIGRLVEEKYLRWDQTFASLVDDLTKDMKSPCKDATLEEFMNHTAGLPYQVPGQEQIATVSSVVEGRELLVRLAMAAPDAVKPGSRMLYASGINAAVVMAERVTGKTFEDLITTYVGEELGLSSIRMGMDAVDATVPRGHIVDSKTHDYVRYGHYEWWGKNMKFRCDAAVSVTGKADQIAQLMSFAAGYGGPHSKALLKTSHEKPMSISPYTQGGWSTNALGLFHYGSTGQGDWSAVQVVDSSKTAVFVYLNCNFEDNSFKGTVLLDEVVKLCRA